MKQNKSDIIGRRVIVLIVLFILSQFWVYQVNIITPTGSMKPTMDAYDITVTDLTYDLDKVEEGDVIVYNHNCDSSEMVDNKQLKKYTKYVTEANVMHRVVADLGDEGLLTKGDNNKKIDQYQKNNCINNITEDNYEGKLVYHADANLIHYIPVAIIILITLIYLFIQAIPTSKPHN